MTLTTTATTILLLVAVVAAEFVPLAVDLTADETKMHKFDAYLRSPGLIDLQNLTFFVPVYDSFDDQGDDDTVNGVNGWDDLGDDSTSGGGRWLTDAAPGAAPGSVVDVVIFQLPSSCASNKKGCNYADLGVGASAADGTMRYCCTLDAANKGLCSNTEELLGRLILNKSKFVGHNLALSVPATGNFADSLPNALFTFDRTGHYIVAFANCNENGQSLVVEGNMVFMSNHGFLPGELFGVMRFYYVLTLFYGIMLAWYGGSMLRNADSRIPIEKWIFATILLGLVEIACQATDFVTWNRTGYQRLFFVSMYIIFGSLKNGLARCLAVMVGLGWGVVRDDLGPSMRTIVVLGFAYMIGSVMVDLLIIFWAEDEEILSQESEEAVVDAATGLSFFLALLDVIFFMWMLDALNNTMEYLEENNQLRKLQRYLRLRTLFIFTMLGAVFWSVFSLVDTYDEQGILLEENEWIVQALKETIFCAALLGVAVLWRPNPNAKEYAYVMELPAMGADGELELSGVVPSAMDDDDDYDDDMESPSGGKTRNGGYSDREIS